MSPRPRLRRITYGLREVRPVPRYQLPALSMAHASPPRTSRRSGEGGTAFVGYRRLRRGKQDEKTYCLTGKCSRDVECCLTKRAPVASLSCGRAVAPLPFHKSMLTDVGPVELWATRWRRPSVAANPQGSSGRFHAR